ncbi:MAG: hypothetical protein GY943_16750 [Chloroflexi bacterium]|nr:hypothetical protein [Chloroflexota bacterium]
MTEKAHVNVPHGSTDGTLQGAIAIGFIPVPLTAVREVVANDIPAIAANGGVLASDSTPILEFANGDTDSALRINWAAGNSDPIVFQVPLPPDLDVSKDFEIHFRAAMAGATDAPAVNADTYFNEGDTKVEGSVAVSGVTFAEYIITVAAADVPTGAQTSTVELTPDAHTTDALYVTSIWGEYTRAN